MSLAASRFKHFFLTISLLHRRSIRTSGHARKNLSRVHQMAGEKSGRTTTIRSVSVPVPDSVSVGPGLTGET